MNKRRASTVGEGANDSEPNLLLLLQYHSQLEEEFLEPEEIFPAFYLLVFEGEISWAEEEACTIGEGDKDSGTIAISTVVDSVSNEGRVF